MDPRDLRRHKFIAAGRVYCRDRDLCVATENNCQGRTCVAIEFFYVAIEGVGCRSLLCYDIRFYVVT